MATTYRWAGYHIEYDDGTRGQGSVRLDYDANDPHAVTLLFIGGGEQIPWTFARDILRRHIPGTGDVRCDVDGLWTVLRLASNTEVATVKILNANVDAFLAKTARLVPYGKEAEVLDFDAELDALLSGGTR